MRITFLNPVGVIGGAERVLLTGLRSLSDHLDKSQLSVVLLADGPLRSEIERLGVSTTVVPLPDGLARQGDTQLRVGGRTRVLAGLAMAVLSETPKGIKFLRQLRATLKRLNPDLIHTNGVKAHALAVMARPRNVRILWHIHDFPSHRPAISNLLRRLSKRVGGAIAISDAVRADTEATFPGLAVRVVRNAIDTDHFAPADGNGSSLDQLSGLNPSVSGTLRIGLLATYANWKGQDVFLEAAALVSQLPDLSPVRFYVIGGPIYTTTGSQFSEAGLRELTHRLGLDDRVGFIPFQRDPAEIYRMLDIVVHASTRPEPFGLTIAEAMASGKPVVVAAAGGATELFTPGHDGIGHIPGDAQDLSQAIARLIVDPELRLRLGSNARKTAVERFSQDRYAKEIAAVYASLCPENRMPGGKHP